MHSDLPLNPGVTCWLVGDGWFVLREKYCWLVADKPNEQRVEIVSIGINT
jgi:hypothetical protein